ncbi:hypothetical protein ACI8AA_17825 [Geodermatophilus sp. SYSU D01180]
MTVGVVDAEVVADAVNVIRKGGTAVITGPADPTTTTVELDSSLLILFEKPVKGSLSGSGDPFHDVPEMVELHRSGDLELDELVAQTYTLEEVDEGHQDLVDGKSTRGVILFDTPPLEETPA